MGLDPYGLRTGLLGGPNRADQDELTEEEAAKRRDKIARRMLNTPPKPHKDSIKGSRDTIKKGGGHKDRRQSTDALT